ncbi:MAG: hypothetical protein WA728_35375 [Xanthobacteraceae bacterium]
MKTFVLALALFFAVFAAALVADVRASLAYQSGDSQWCTVTDKGDLMAWEWRRSPAPAATARSIHIGIRIHRRTGTELLPPL